MKPPLPWIRYMELSFWAKRAPWKLPNSSGYWQSYWLIPKNLHRSPIAVDKIYRYWTQKSQTGASLEPPALLKTVHSTWWYSAHYQRRKVNEYKSSHRRFSLQWWSDCTMCWGKSGTKVIGVTTHYLLWLKAQFMRRYP